MAGAAPGGMNDHAWLVRINRQVLINFEIGIGRELASCLPLNLDCLDVTCMFFDNSNLLKGVGLGQNICHIGRGQEFESLVGCGLSCYVKYNM